MSFFLHGLGHFHPENIITNKFLEELDIGTDEQWILERVGIHSRRTVLSLDYIKETQNLDPRGTTEASMYTHATTGKIAAQLALDRAGLRSQRSWPLIVLAYPRNLSGWSLQVLVGRGSHLPLTPVQ